MSGGGNTTHTSACAHSVCLSPPRLSLLLRKRTCDGTLHRNDVCFFHEQITYYRAQPPQLVLCKVVSIPKLRYPAIHVCVVCSHRLLRLLQFFIREKKTITGVGRRLRSWLKAAPFPSSSSATFVRQDGTDTVWEEVGSGEYAFAKEEERFVRLFL